MNGIAKINLKGKEYLTTATTHVCPFLFLTTQSYSLIYFFLYKPSNKKGLFSLRNFLCVNGCSPYSNGLGKKIISLASLGALFFHMFYRKFADPIR